MNLSRDNEVVWSMKAQWKTGSLLQYKFISGFLSSPINSISPKTFFTSLGVQSLHLLICFGILSRPIARSVRADTLEQMIWKENLHKGSHVGVRLTIDSQVFAKPWSSLKLRRRRRPPIVSFLNDSPNFLVNDVVIAGLVFLIFRARAEIFQRVILRDKAVKLDGGIVCLEFRFAIVVGIGAHHDEFKANELKRNRGTIDRQQMQLERKKWEERQWGWEITRMIDDRNYDVKYNKGTTEENEGTVRDNVNNSITVYYER
ncbi:MAG: hypothetical protein V2I33_16515 [Kangiellaceae bacterium]|nr:hypothetical protein [Kangiellaceae bacterium]